MQTKPCVVCGREFAKSPAHSQERWETRTRYCSRQCFGADYSRRFKKIPERACGACGKIFRPEHFGAKYCSTDCAKDRFLHRRGTNSPAWRGGRIKQDGYVRIRKEGRYVMEHRLVMEQMIGRPLLATETVHHKNGVRDDNRPENLELYAGRHTKGASSAHCATCTCFDRQIG